MSRAGNDAQNMRNYKAYKGDYPAYGHSRRAYQGSQQHNAYGRAFDIYSHMPGLSAAHEHKIKGTGQKKEQDAADYYNRRRPCQLNIAGRSEAAIVQESTESIWLLASIIINVCALVSKEEMHMPARSRPVVELPV